MVCKQTDKSRKSQDNFVLAVGVTAALLSMLAVVLM